MTVKRWRCSLCGELVEEDHLQYPKTANDLPRGLCLAAKVFPEKCEGYLNKPYHRGHRFRAAGGGRIGYNSWTEPCGPVEVEEISEFQDAFEHFVGEKL